MKLAVLVGLVGCATDPTPPSFTLVHQNETAALLSTWGQSASDVWVVGGRPDLASGPTVLHFDGTSWTRVDTGQPGIDLWWVFGVGGDVFMSGSSSAILRYRSGAFERMATPTSDGTIFGMWGPAPDDVWAVGRAGAGAGLIVWHYDGTAWTDVALPAGFPLGLLGFKVHGQRTDDAWISCSGGMTLHWDGSALASAPTGDTASLFSIVTTSTDVITAGGVVATTGVGALDENSAGIWQSAPLMVTAEWRGLAASTTDEVWVVGEGGLIARRDQSKQWTLLQQPLIQSSFHADWIDPDGGFWGVGGDFDQTPLTQDGFLLYYGTRHVPAIPEN